MKRMIACAIVAVLESIQDVARRIEQVGELDFSDRGDLRWMGRELERRPDEGDRRNDSMV